MNDDRLIILEAMLLIEKDGAKYVIANVLDKYSYLDIQDRRFIKRILEGTLERRIELDYIIDSFSKVKVNKLKPVIRNILRMGIYQLKYMDSVPASAVCNEAVKLAEKKGFRNLKGYVNGVLRNVARNLNAIEYPGDTITKLSVTCSCPKWLCEWLVNQYGEGNTETILLDSLEQSPLHIRVNNSKISVRELKDMLTHEGLLVESVLNIEDMLSIKNVDSIESLKSFNRGLFQVQDISSVLVGKIAGIEKNAVVFDVCAAPGGKTVHALDILQGTGEVFSFDVSENKTELIRENVNRCGFKNVIIEERDALCEYPEYFEKADVLIADLPCSGLGVLRRKNDIKYNVTIDGLKELAQLQRQMLTNVSRYVKPGGIMIFSTCTINPGENVDNYRWILENLPFDYVDFFDYLPEQLRKNEAKCGYLQLVQGLDGTDGFFISKFRKKTDGI